MVLPASSHLNDHHIYVRHHAVALQPPILEWTKQFGYFRSDASASLSFILIMSTEPPTLSEFTSATPDEVARWQKVFSEGFGKYGRLSIETIRKCTVTDICARLCLLYPLVMLLVEVFCMHRQFRMLNLKRNCSEIRENCANTLENDS